MNTVSSNELATMQTRHLRHPTLRLETSIRRQAELSEFERAQMFALMAAHFDNVRETDFLHDLAEKEWVVTITVPERGILGFTTAMRLSTEYGGQQLTAFFSGDTILDPQIWGASTWVRVLARHVAGLMKEIEDQPVYWLLLTSTHRTYRALPALLQEYHPRRSNNPPSIVEEHLDALVRLKFPEEYDAAQGIVRLRKPTPVKSDRVPLAVRGMTDSTARFFADRNPGFLNGDYLACIGDLGAANRTRLGARLLRP